MKHLIITTSLLLVMCALIGNAHADTFEECIPSSDFLRLQDQVLGYYDDDNGFPSAKHAIVFAFLHPTAKEACSSLAWFLGSDATPSDIHYALTAMRLFECKNFPIPMNGLATMQKNLNNSDPEIAFHAIGAHWRVYGTNKKENAEWQEVVRNLRRIVQEGDADTMEKLTYAYATMSTASLMLEERLQKYYNNFDNEVMSLLQDIEKAKPTKTQFISMGNLLYHLAMLSKLKSFFYPATKAMVERQTYKIFEAIIDAPDLSETAPLIPFLIAFHESEFMICDDPETKLALQDFSNIFIAEEKPITAEANVTDADGSDKFCTDPDSCTEPRSEEDASSNAPNNDSKQSSGKKKKKSKDKKRQKKGKKNDSIANIEVDEVSTMTNQNDETDVFQTKLETGASDITEDITSSVGTEALSNDDTLKNTAASVPHAEESSFPNSDNQEISIQTDSVADHSADAQGSDSSAASKSKDSSAIPSKTKQRALSEEKRQRSLSEDTTERNMAGDNTLDSIEEEGIVVQTQVFDIYAFASKSEQYGILVHSLQKDQVVSPVPAVVNYLKFVVQLRDAKSADVLQPATAAVQTILKETSYKVPLESPNYATMMLQPDDEGNLVATLKFKDNKTIRSINGLYAFSLIISKEENYSFESPTASLWLSFRASTPISIFKRFDGTFSAILEHFKHYYPMETIRHTFSAASEAPTPLTLAFVSTFTAVTSFIGMLYIWRSRLKVNLQLFSFSVTNVLFLFFLSLQAAIMVAYFIGVNLPQAVIMSAPLVMVIAALGIKVLLSLREKRLSLKSKELKSE